MSLQLQELLLPPLLQVLPQLLLLLRELPQRLPLLLPLQRELLYLLPVYLSSFKYSLFKITITLIDVSHFNTIKFLVGYNLRYSVNDTINLRFHL